MNRLRCELCGAFPGFHKPRGCYCTNWRRDGAKIPTALQHHGRAGLEDGQPRKEPETFVEEIEDTLWTGQKF